MIASRDSRIRGSVAAVILNWNQAALTLQCLASLRAEVDHVYLVDNDSHPSDRALLCAAEDDTTTVLLNATNGGYASGCNRGVEAAVEAGFAAVLIMNNDAFPDTGSIDLLIDRLEDAAHVGAVGPTVVRRDTREVLHVGCTLDLRTGRSRWSERGVSLDALGGTPVPTGYLSGEVMLVRSALIQEITMFDERYFCYYEDVDWSIRAHKAGWVLEVIPRAIFEHIVGASSVAHTGAYFRARNLPLLLRIACGRTRLTAFILAAPTELVAFGALLRRGRLALAFRGVIGGWIAGVAMRS